MTERPVDSIPTDVCAILPTYDNERTLADIVRRTLPHVARVIVVDDGSTPATLEVLGSLHDERLTVVSYHPNRGKGHALKVGMEKAIDMGFSHAVTLDTDGQHFPEDIPLLLNEHRKHPEALIVGVRNLSADGMPRGNTFANRFSNFWFRVQTLQSIDDTQSGFRLYPLHKVSTSWMATPRYEAELEMLVLAAWHGIELRQVPVRVYYPPADERVSHFRPYRDFARISLLNCVLCLGALVYFLPRLMFRSLARLPHLFRRSCMSLHCSDSTPKDKQG
jgi:glycosyltransferase involved in cell wall biosynthesis